MQYLSVTASSRPVEYVVFIQIHFLLVFEMLVDCEMYNTAKRGMMESVNVTDHHYE